MGGSNWPPWLPKAKAVQLNSVCLNPTGQLSNAWALFLGYYLGCLSFLFFFKKYFSTSFPSPSWRSNFFNAELFQITNSETHKHDVQSPRAGWEGGGIHSGILRFKKSYNIVLGTQRTTY